MQSRRSNEGGHERSRRTRGRRRWVGGLRLISGLALFAYATTHLLNHSLGLVSLDALEDGRRVFLWVWRNPLLWAAPPLAIVTHVSLALYSLLQRKTFRRMTAWEVTQAALGHLVPIFLLGHVVQTLVMHTVYGVQDSYRFVLTAGPFDVWFLAGLLVAAWTHGCIGAQAWFRLQPWYPRIAGFLWGVIVGLPVLAVGGVLRARTELSRTVTDVAWLDRAAGSLTVEDYRSVVLVLYAAVLGTVLAVVLLAWLARGAYELYRRRLPHIFIRYPNGVVAQVREGTSVLEASRAAGIPHASVCGGRGRCSTCRVHVVAGLEQLPSPGSRERAVLQRIGAPGNVRLACQLRPSVAVHVSPVLNPKTATASDGFADASSHEGREQTVVILFADLRGFTALSERRLPYDVVHILNQYFRLMGEAIEAHGGYLDKFIGDGVMAIFGVDGEPDAARSALAAARAMLSRLDELNAFLSPVLERSLRMGIGIHSGPAILGRMGYGHRRHFTAIGDTVNTASRLQEMTKTLAASIVVSEDVLLQGGIELPDEKSHVVEVRGRKDSLTVVAVKDPERLAVFSGPRSA